MGLSNDEKASIIAIGVFFILGEEYGRFKRV